MCRRGDECLLPSNGVRVATPLELLLQQGGWPSQTNVYYAFCFYRKIFLEETAALISTGKRELGMAMNERKQFYCLPLNMLSIV